MSTSAGRSSQTDCLSPRSTTPRSTAFDAHLIGVDPDYRIHVSERLLELHDGPFLELGLKKIAGELIRLPRRTADYPDSGSLSGLNSSRGPDERQTFPAGSRSRVYRTERITGG
jgi:hypothetical protein